MKNQEKSFNDQPKKRYTGRFIPVEIERLGLSLAEEKLLSIIDAYDSDAPNYCYASNRLLAQELKISESRISFYITRLTRMKLVELMSMSGRIRRLRSMRENWYTKTKLTEESKKESCVKPRRHKFGVEKSCEHSNKQSCVESRRDTTWNHVGTLRENTIENDPQSYIYDKKRDDKKSRLEEYDIVKEAALPDDRFSSQSEFIVSPSTVFFGTQGFNPHAYKMPNGQPLSKRCANAFAKYSFDDRPKLYANISYFEDLYRKNPGKYPNPERFLQECINRDYAKGETLKMQNRMLANLISDEQGIKINILKTVVQINGESIDLNLPADTFAEILRNNVRKNKVI